MMHSLGRENKFSAVVSESPLMRLEILDAMCARVDKSLLAPMMIPAQAGGWWHQYVCPEHGLPLIFELTSPRLHRCPAGETYQGENYDAAFRVFAHRHYSALARDAALLYRETTEVRYLNAASEVLSQYATLYNDFESSEHNQPWMLPGKAFHQALTEAIWSVPLIQAFEILRSALSQPQIDQIKDDLLTPIAQVLTSAHEKLVFQQNNLKSNYTAWLIAALGCLGFVLSKDELVERAIYGPGGFAAHLNAAILPDGFEYEGSPYYHNFVAWAYTLLAETASRHNVDLYAIKGKDGQSIQAMWSALASLAWQDGSIPSLHDGNYWQNSSFDIEFLEVYESALSRTGKQRYAWLLDCAYRRSGYARDSWAALLFANQDIADSQQLPVGSTCLENIGLVVLRNSNNPNSLSALLRFGPYGGSHTHLDSLSLLLFPFSLDAGNPPYGDVTRQSWYQQTAAHNTIMVDGQSQAEVDGRLIAWVDESGFSEVEAVSDDAYPGVKFSRRVRLEESQISDRVRVSAEDERTFDWLLHTDEVLDCGDFNLSPVEGSLFQEGAGAFIQLTAKGKCTEEFQVTLGSGCQKFRLTLSSPKPFEIILARSPKRGGVDMAERYTLVARFYGRETDFSAHYEGLQ